LGSALSGFDLHFYWLYSQEAYQDYYPTSFYGLSYPLIENNIINRSSKLRASDDINIHRNYYRFTENLDTIWPSRDKIEEVFQEVDQLKMF
jgi:hypothetical protein